MGCGTSGVEHVMVGLHRVGVVGLLPALKKADAAGLSDREATLDLLMELVGEKNYIPEGNLQAFRTAIWREFLRFKGEDYRDFFSEVEVTVAGDAGEERDHFVRMLSSVFSTFELKPVITFVPSDPQGPNPQLRIGDHLIVAGSLSRKAFETAVRKSFSDW